MNMLRLAFVAWFFVGWVVGFGVCYNWAKTATIPDDTKYTVTPHILDYYSALRVDHYPAPEFYTQGNAGTDYCRNLADWYVSIALKLSNNWDRALIREYYLPGFDYEVAHDWLTRFDANRLTKFIANAPHGLPPEYLAEVAYDYCQSREPV